MRMNTERRVNCAYKELRIGTISRSEVKIDSIRQTLQRELVKIVNNVLERKKAKIKTDFRLCRIS